jgi:hypothetical protein
LLWSGISALHHQQLLSAPASTRAPRCDPRQEKLRDFALAQQPVWQRRFYDFAVWSAAKRQEKLHYIHQNPVRRGLVLEPEQWAWSSARYYLLGEAGPVVVGELLRAEMKVRPVG